MSGKGHLDIGTLPITLGVVHFFSVGWELGAVESAGFSRDGSSLSMAAVEASSTSCSILRNSSFRSSVARRNSAKPLPSALASSGSFFGPSTISARPRIKSNSGMPMPNIQSNYAISAALARLLAAWQSPSRDVSFKFMATTAVVVDREYLKHRPGDGHPERPERVKVLLDLAGELDRGKFHLLAPQPAKRTDIEAIHGTDYVRVIEATAARDVYALDGDTITCRDSFAVSVLAVGGFLNLIDSIAANEVRNGFALVRPPGHHALRSRAMGFCLFNTMAIAAEYVKRIHGAKKVWIMDWDVHHGNGTQDAFYDDPSVLFISTHQYPFYPGSGAVNEVGVGAGEGFTLNIPLPAGSADREYLEVFHHVIVPAAEWFQPDWILVSAGFDPHRRDPLGGMAVTEVGFAAMARRLLALAENFCGGKIAFLLEGGYDLAGLKNSVAAVLDVIQRGDPSMDQVLTLSDSRIAPLIGRILQVREKYQ